MKQNSIFFVLFLLLFSIFIWFMMDFWTSFMAIGSQNARYSDLSGRSLRLVAYFLVVYCFLVLLLSLSTFKIKGIFLTCLLWIGFMPILSMVNSTHVSSIGELCYGQCYLWFLFVLFLKTRIESKLCGRCF